MLKKTTNSVSKEMHFYPGRDAKYSYVALPVSHMLIHGTAVELRTALIHNLMVRLIEEQGAGQLRITIVDANDTIAKMYRDIQSKGRVVQHVEEIISFKKGDDKLEEVSSLIDSIITAQSENKHSYSTMYFLVGFDEIIKNADAEPGRVREFYNKLKQLTKAVSGSNCYIIADFGDKSLPDDVISLFPTRCCLKTSNIDMSHKLLGSDVAAYYDGDSKYIWIKPSRTEVIRLYVPMRPDNWNKNFLMAFAQKVDKVTKSDAEQVDTATEQAEDETNDVRAVHKSEAINKIEIPENVQAAINDGVATEDGQTEEEQEGSESAE